MLFRSLYSVQKSISFWEGSSCDLFYIYFLHWFTADFYVTGMAINEKSYFTLSAHRPVTFVGVFDAPFELADQAIVKRLDVFYECQVVNTYYNCHQGTNISNGVRASSVVLNRVTLTSGYLRIWTFSSSFVLPGSALP